MTDIPALLNGYPVIASKPVGDDYFIVAVFRGADYPEQPFVVATWWPVLGPSWSQGDYIATLSELAQIYEERITLAQERSR